MTLSVRPRAMNGSGASTVGERITAARHRRGMARRTLADLVGRSEEWLRQIETGQRHLDSIQYAMRLARILDLGDLAALLAIQSDRKIPVEDDDSFLPVRRALLDAAVLHALPVEQPMWTDAARTLIADVVWAWEGWLAKGERRYTNALKSLPRLLRGAAAHLLDSAGKTEPEPAMAAYHLARTVLARAGQQQLAWLVADRAFRTATTVGGPALLAEAWHLAKTYLRHGYLSEAQSLATAAANFPTEDTTPGELAVLRGALYLIAAEAAAGDLHADASRAGQLLEHATRELHLVGTDTSVRQILFGPTEVGLAAVEVAARQGRTSDGLRRAAQVTMPDDYPADGHVRYYARLAQLHARRKEDAAAVFALGRLVAVSAEDIRYDQLAHEALRRLVRRDNSTVRGELHRLARMADMV